MNRLGNGSARSKAKLGRTKAVIKMYCQSFLKERCINLIHSISKGDRPIVGEELCVLLIVLHKHDYFGVQPG